MRYVARVCVVLGLLAGVGCGKKVAKKTEAETPPEDDTPVAAATTKGTTKAKPYSGPSNAAKDAPSFTGAAAGTAVVVNPGGNLGGGGGGGGGVMMVRKAAGRAVNLAQMKDLHLTIFQQMQQDPDERVPDKDTILMLIRQNGVLSGLVKDEVIILTGSTAKDGIWAYTQFPQKGANHFIVTRAGVEDLRPADLKERLEAQNSEVKLAR